MDEIVILLKNLAAYYGGEYTEVWENATIPDETLLTVCIKTPRTIFRHSCRRNSEEPAFVLQQRVRMELIWSILQKGVEFVNEQSDIFKLFNPDKKL